MPPSGFNQKAVKGALQFIQGCYEDLEAEVVAGKHANFKEALTFELDNLEKALSELHINKKWKLVKRKIKK